jgi:hypothetical protein
LTTTATTLHDKINIKLFAEVNNRIMVGDKAALNAMNAEYHFKIKRETEERIFHRMGKVYKFLEMCQGSSNLHDNQNGVMR